AEFELGPSRQGRGQDVMGAGAVRLQSDSLLELSDCLAQPAPPSKGQAEVQACGHVARSEGQRRRVEADRLVYFLEGPRAVDSLGELEVDPEIVGVLTLRLSQQGLCPVGAQGPGEERQGLRGQRADLRRSG